jgi:hypothetical protein
MMRCWPNGTCKPARLKNKADESNQQPKANFSTGQPQDTPVVGLFVQSKAIILIIHKMEP